MHRTVTNDRSSPRATAQPREKLKWLTQIAFALTLALVICRVLMSDTIRSAIDPLEGATASPLPPGPGTGLALDLLCCLPALLVLARSAFDTSCTLRRSWLFWPMLMLGAWALLSFFWASDRFSAIVSASHVATSLVLLWSTAQLIGSWLRLRLVGGVCVGLLIALAIVGYYYRFSELPDLKSEWEHNRAEILASNHIAPGSPEELQFSRRLLGGEPMGFSASTNSYAAIIVLLGIVAAGVAIQRFADGDHWGWAIVPIIAALASIPLIHWTRCRAAHATPVLAALILLVIWLARPILRRFARPLFVISLAGIAMVTSFVVHHGIRNGTLWHDSLNFRWNYWVGSYGVLTQDLPQHQYKQFLLGVGWENFGPHYLAHRLQVAAEEIRDPHNFIVRVFVELGLIGGTLLLIWMLKMWWELTRPTWPEQTIATRSYGSRFAITTIVIIASLAIVLNVALSIDFTSAGAFVFLEIVRRAVFWAAILAGMSAALMNPMSLARPIPQAANASESDRARKDKKSSKLSYAGPDVHNSSHIVLELDERPAPWVLYAILAAIGTFLVHNLIEFSFFEAGPMFLFALLSGSVLGLRLAGRDEKQNIEAALVSRRISFAALAGGTIACLAWAAMIFLPISLAEGASHDADNAARERHWNQAIADMQEARGRVPYNSEYAMRTAKYLLKQPAAARDPSAVVEARKLLDAAAATDPSSMPDLVARAQLELEPQINDIPAALNDYNRAVTLDPANLRLRIEYANVLKSAAQKLHDSSYSGMAIRELYRVLDKNEEYHWDEPKRLSKDELDAVKKTLVELEGPQSPKAQITPATGPGPRDLGR